MCISWDVWHHWNGNVILKNFAHRHDGVRNPQVTDGFRASDAELWCFLWYQPVQAAEQQSRVRWIKMSWWSFDVTVIAALEVVILTTSGTASWRIKYVINIYIAYHTMYYVTSGYTIVVTLILSLETTAFQDGNKIQTRLIFCFCHSFSLFEDNSTIIAITFPSHDQQYDINDMVFWRR